MNGTILILDDEKNIREGLAANFELEGYTVLTACDGASGWQAIERGGVDLVVTDLRMPKLSGMDIVKRTAQKYPAIPVIVLTGHGSVDDAVEAMKFGAHDFLTKPVNLDALNAITKRALDGRNLKLAHTALLNTLATTNATRAIIGKSPAIKKVFTLIEKVAPTAATALITGPSGAGKELVARAIHDASPRAKKPFVAVNCAALSESLLESELFGHERGSFTGATETTKGRFELADGGTLFLDEIGEITSATQVKLLRVLQEKAFERVGGAATLKVDVRVVAATNKNLAEEVKKGAFREDLFYRLNVINIAVPPLSERREDIPLLIDAFLKQFAATNNRAPCVLSDEVKTALLNYSWPGNVRQLQNCIESACVLCDKSLIRLSDIDPTIAQAVPQENFIKIPFGTTLLEAQKLIATQTLALCSGNKSRAAKILGIERKTLMAKL